eukprot:gene339-606_t
MSTILCLSVFVTILVMSECFHMPISQIWRAKHVFMANEGPHHLDSVSILDVIGHYVTDVQSQGGSEHKCLCPFHDDTNPSLTINDEKGLYHCFSCGAGGNTAKFVMDFENIPYGEALQQIYEITGIPVTPNPYDSFRPQDREKKTRLLAVMEAASNYFCERLFKDRKAGAARSHLLQLPLPLISIYLLIKSNYKTHLHIEKLISPAPQLNCSFPTDETSPLAVELEKSIFLYPDSRNVSSQTVVNFRIGFAPFPSDSGSLVANLTGMGFDPADIVAAGLATNETYIDYNNNNNITSPLESAAVEAEAEARQLTIPMSIQSGNNNNNYNNNYRIYDRFRNRLMIPIYDKGHGASKATQGAVIAFGARILGAAKTKTDTAIDTDSNVLENNNVNVPSLSSFNQAKYYNSPETDLFQKASRKSTLFGLQISRPGVAREGAAVLVEGYFDVICLAEIGVDNALAAMGTAISKEQLLAAARCSKQKVVILLLDNDQAGIDATMRLCTKIAVHLPVEDVELRVADLTRALDFTADNPEETDDEGSTSNNNKNKNSSINSEEHFSADVVAGIKDPADLSNLLRSRLGKDGAAARIKKMLQEARNSHEWVLDRYMSRFLSDPNSASFSSAVRDVCSYLEALPLATDRAYLSDYCATKVSRGNRDLKLKYEYEIMAMSSPVGNKRSLGVKQKASSATTVAGTGTVAEAEATKDKRIKQETSMKVNNTLVESTATVTTPPTTTATSSESINSSENVSAVPIPVPAVFSRPMDDIKVVNGGGGGGGGCVSQFLPRSQRLRIRQQRPATNDQTTHVQNDDISTATTTTTVEEEMAMEVDSPSVVTDAVPKPVPMPLPVSTPVSEPVPMSLTTNSQLRMPVEEEMAIDDDDLDKVIEKSIRLAESQGLDAFENEMRYAKNERFNKKSNIVVSKEEWRLLTTERVDALYERKSRVTAPEALLLAIAVHRPQLRDYVIRSVRGVADIPLPIANVSQTYEWTVIEHAAIWDVLVDMVYASDAKDHKHLHNDNDNDKDNDNDSPQDQGQGPGGSGALWRKQLGDLFDINDKESSQVAGNGPDGTGAAGTTRPIDIAVLRSRVKTLLEDLDSKTYVPALISTDRLLSGEMLQRRQDKDLVYEIWGAEAELCQYRCSQIRNAIPLGRPEDADYCVAKEVEEKSRGKVFHFQELREREARAMEQQATSAIFAPIGPMEDLLIGVEEEKALFQKEFFPQKPKISSDPYRDVEPNFDELHLGYIEIISDEEREEEEAAERQKAKIEQGIQDVRMKKEAEEERSLRKSRWSAYKKSSEGEEE